jgi:hypothetical protein
MKKRGALACWQTSSSTQAVKTETNYTGGSIVIKGRKKILGAVCATRSHVHYMYVFVGSACVWWW